MSFSYELSNALARGDKDVLAKYQKFVQKQKESQQVVLSMPNPCSCVQLFRDIAAARSVDEIDELLKKPWVPCTGGGSSCSK